MTEQPETFDILRDEDSFLCEDNCIFLLISDLQVHGTSELIVNTLDTIVCGSVISFLGLNVSRLSILAIYNLKYEV